MCTESARHWQGFAHAASTIHNNQTAKLHFRIEWVVRTVPFFVHNFEYLTTYLFRYLGTFSWLFRSCSHNDNCITPLTMCGVSYVFGMSGAGKFTMLIPILMRSRARTSTTEAPTNIQTSFAHSEKNIAHNLLFRTKWTNQNGTHGRVCSVKDWNDTLLQIREKEINRLHKM